MTMGETTRKRTAAFQARLGDAGVDIAILTDEDTIAYLAGFWGYLGIEFGRPTFLIVPKDASPTVITPLMELEMVSAMTWVEDVRPWEDAGPRGWEEPLAELLGGAGTRRLGVEADKLPRVVSAFLGEHQGDQPLEDISHLLGSLRMIKDPEEIQIMREAGAIAVAMVEAAKAALGIGVPEYEVALAVLQGGTRKAAGFLTDRGWEGLVSPLIHDLQIMQSGRRTAMVHRRASVRRLERGDPVYLCFCNQVQFKHYKLGFDRQFFVATVTDEQARIFETTVAAQQAALAAIKPGITAEEVHFAAEAIYRDSGFSPGYRTGRAIGQSYLEAPELKAGDKTRLQAGMTFAVDGGITLPGRFGTRIGDSIVVSETGFDYLTDYPRALSVV